jgi:hypothetical protein
MIASNIQRILFVKWNAELQVYSLDSTTELLLTLPRLLPLPQLLRLTRDDENDSPLLRRDTELPMALLTAAVSSAASKSSQACE